MDSLGPSSRVSDLVDLEWRPEILYVYHVPQVMLIVVGPRITL